MSSLLLTNLPCNATDNEIREWIESKGIGARSLRIVRDPEGGVSPAFGHVELQAGIRVTDAIAVLNGSEMQHQTVLAKAITTVLGS